MMVAPHPLPLTPSPFRCVLVLNISEKRRNNEAITDSSSLFYDYADELMMFVIIYLVLFVYMPLVLHSRSDDYLHVFIFLF